MASATAPPAKAKKASAATKKPKAHPPYVEMVSEAIIALKERSGSSQMAIAKFIEEKQKDHLPSNFRKLLLLQLKKLVASGKLTRVKNSFKMAGTAKTGSSAASAAAAKKPKDVKKVTEKKKTAVKAKTTTAAPKKKAPVKKTKAATPAKKKPATSAAAKKVKKTPVKKPAVSKVKKTPVKKAVKKPKSIKSPAKKAKK